jgi:hypothetical protein
MAFAQARPLELVLHDIDLEGCESRSGTVAIPDNAAIIWEKSFVSSSDGHQLQGVQRDSAADPRELEGVP